MQNASILSTPSTTFHLCSLNVLMTYGPIYYVYDTAVDSKLNMTSSPVIREVCAARNCSELERSIFCKF